METRGIEILLFWMAPVAGALGSDGAGERTAGLRELRSSLW